MSRKFKILLACLALVIGGLVYMESIEKDPVNWYSSYLHQDKIPYGTFVLHHLLERQMDDATFTTVNKPPYEFLANSTQQAKGTYFFVNQQISFDEVESNKLLNWVSRGNTLFIAGKDIGVTILDTLQLKVDFYYDLDNFERKPLVNLSHPSLMAPKPYSLDREVATQYFSSIDTLKTIVLGTFGLLKKQDSTNISEPQIHFIKQPFGEGYIYIHLLPEVFTNYFILKDKNDTYVKNVFKYLPPSNSFFWDTHYKNGGIIRTSPLYVFLENRYLRWAYYLLITGVFIWVFFEGKRKQRPIPVRLPRTNQTLAFTKTIAGMYLVKKDHKSIAIHQINHFVLYLTEILLQSPVLDSVEYQRRIALKTGNTEKDTKTLFDLMLLLKDKQAITQEELVTLNRLIDTFKKTYNGR